MILLIQSSPSVLISWSLYLTESSREDLSHTVRNIVTYKVLLIDIVESLALSIASLEVGQDGH